MYIDIDILSAFLDVIFYPLLILYIVHFVLRSSFLILRVYVCSYGDDVSFLEFLKILFFRYETRKQYPKEPINFDSIFDDKE